MFAIAPGENVRMRMHHASVVMGSFIAIGACGTPLAPSDTTPPPPSDNPIDIAIWPRLVASGLTDLPAASNAELCRRMSLDLTGVTPDANDIATICTGKTPEQIARGFLASPRFRDVERRFWIRRLGADPTEVMADHIADADRIFQGAADGAIGYDDLVARLLARPITTINRPVAAGNDVAPTVRKIFQLFLGRLPSQDELDDYANLLRPWLRRNEDRYDLGYGYYVDLAVLDPNACTDPVLGNAACTSTALGAVTTIAPVVTPMAPPGHSQTDARYFYYELVEGAVPDALEAELEKPGRLLATREELWDEAADFALARYLGWWRSSANVPDTVLPEVRRALADWFRHHDGHDLRELYVTVMTSLLYTTSSEMADGGDRPPWAIGPTKLLEPEQLLDSVGRALDRQLGLCDPHTDEPVKRNFFWPDRLRVQQPADYYGFGYDFYYDTGQRLGGCIGAVAAPHSPGLPALLAHIDLARTLCDSPSQILPPGVDPGAAPTTAIGAFLFGQLLARPPADDELAALDTATAGCASDPTCGDAISYAREVCGSVIRSTAFLYY